MNQLKMLMIEEFRKALDVVAKAYVGVKFQECSELIKKDIMETAHEALGTY